jgi:hypothetical protein
MTDLEQIKRLLDEREKDKTTIAMVVMLIFFVATILAFVIDNYF